MYNIPILQKGTGFKNGKYDVSTDRVHSSEQYRHDCIFGVSLCETSSVHDYTARAAISHSAKKA